MGAAGSSPPMTSEHDAATKIQTIWRAHRARQEQAAQAQAASKVQAVQRGNTLRKKQARLEEATVRVQAIQRGRLTRGQSRSLALRASAENATKNASAPSPHSSREGWLKKQSAAYFVGLQWRWFSLRESSLSYYKGNGDAEARGVIPLCAVVTTSTKGPQINIDVGYRIYHVVAASDAEACAWSEEIQQVVQAGVRAAEGTDVPIHALPFVIPSRLEKLTAEWLTDALRFKGFLTTEGRVAAMEVRPIGEGLGMMADMALLHLTLEGAQPGAPSKMVAKFAPRVAKLPQFIVRLQLRNEAHFYNDFGAAEGGLPRPTCYLAAERQRQKPTFLMLLEMLEDTTVFTRIGGCDSIERLRQVVGTLGSFHARWWGHAQKPPLHWAIHPHAGLGRIVFSRNWFAYSIRKAIPAMEAWDPEAFKPIIAWQELLRSGVTRVVAQCTSPPFSLVHGDAHLDNIFFAERFPGGAAFIDHANMMISKPLLDIAFFMGTNLDPAVRRAREEELLRHYYEQLLAGGVAQASYAWEQCWIDYRWALLQCLFGYVCFIVQDYAKQKANHTGVYADDPAMITKGERHLERMYRGDGTTAGFNKRIVAALVELKCDELLRG